MTADVLRELDAYGRRIDDIAPPVTVAEIESRASHRPNGVVTTRSQVPGWAVAIAAAVLVAALVGGMAWILGGSDGSTPPSDEPLPVFPTDTIESSMTDTNRAQQEQTGIWIHHSGGVLMALTPPLLPPVPGTYEVTVHGYQSGEQGGVWVTACPGAHGVVDPETWKPNQYDIAAICGIPDDQSMATGNFIDGVFETTVLIEVNQDAIEDGGVVITAGHMWVPVSGNVLLRITDSHPTAPEGAQNDLNIAQLTGVISYWPPFVQNFTTTYESLSSCDEAYAQAQAGQTSYLNALEHWDDTQRDKPGYDYDKAVALLLASERWLYDQTCPGRFDFTSVG